MSEIVAQKIYVPTRIEGSFLEVLGVALRLGLTFFGRCHRASRLFPRRIRGAAEVAR
jgi:hypothetical protein